MSGANGSIGRIGFVGGGNMAEALVRGLLTAEEASAEAIRVCDPSEARRTHLAATYGVGVSDDNATLGEWAEVVVLAVKPAVVVPALQTMPSLSADALVVSIAAGVPIALIEGALPVGCRVVRAMPNTAAIVGAGATAIAAGTHAGEAELARARHVFDAVGQCVTVPEKLLDAVTGLSGSGPAYVMVMIEALADGGVRAGLPRDVAQLLAAQTVFGAAKLQLETGEHPGVLKDRVTSPGGTTIAGLDQLESKGVRGALISAVYAAAERSKELGKG